MNPKAHKGATMSDSNYYQKLKPTEVSSSLKGQPMSEKKPSVWVMDDKTFEKYGFGGLLGLVIVVPFMELKGAKSLCVKWDDDCYSGAVGNEREAFKQLRAKGFKYLGRLT